MTVTLRAIHLVNEGSYIVTRDYNTIEVDGLSVQADTFTVSDLSTILHVHTPLRQITHYVNDLGDIMSNETFKEQKGILASKGTEVVEWPGDYLFADLDNEYAFKHFCRTWKPVYNEPSVEKNPVIIELTEVRTNSGDPDIQSMWNSPGMNNNSHLYTLNRLAFTVKEFKNCCEKHELSFTLGGSNSSGIRFAQIDHKYLNFEDMDYSRFGGSFIGTLDQCKAEKERLQNRIQIEVSLFIAKYKTKVGLNNAGEVLNNLDHIRNLVTKISPKSASYSAHRTAIGKINELVESIRKDMLTQDTK